MKYEVEVVGNDELPDGVARVIVERPDAAPLLIITDRAAGTWRFLQEWEEHHRQPAEVFELRRVV